MLYRAKVDDPSVAIEGRRLRKPLILLGCLMCFGVTGYYFLEDASLLDALYMTVITLSTVGYGEVVTLSPEGKEFTILLIMLGVSIGAYSLGAVAASFVEGEVQQMFRRRRMKKNFENLQDHIIVCGYGRLGKHIVHELQQTSLKFVVIESDRDTLSMLHDQQVLYVAGNATEDEILDEAMVRRAKGLITALSKDADNLYVTLSAREMNPDMMIIARAEEISSESKMRRAGATQVVSPFASGGRRMANLLLRPHMISLFEEMSKNDKNALDIVEIPIKKWSNMVGKSLRDCNIQERTGAMVVGVRNAGGELRLNPPADMRMLDDDILIVLGRLENIERLENL